MVPPLQARFIIRRGQTIRKGQTLSVLHALGRTLNSPPRKRKLAAGQPDGTPRGFTARSWGRRGILGGILRGKSGFDGGNDLLNSSTFQFIWRPVPGCFQCLQSIQPAMFPEQHDS